MRRKSIFIFFIVSIFLIAVSASPKKDHIPPGVNPEKWLQISNTSGFLILENLSTKVLPPKIEKNENPEEMWKAMQGRLTTQVKGKFMVRKNNRWFILEHSPIPAEFKKLY